MAKSVSVEFIGGRVVKKVGDGKTSAASATILDEDTDKTRKSVTALVPSIGGQIDALTVDDEDSYQEADRLFGRVKDARKNWTARMEEIIRPIRTGLDKLYKLNRDVDKPLAELEARIERKMKDFKLIEARRVQQEQEQVEQERQRLLKQQEKAKTPTKQQDIAVQLESVEQWEPETVKAANSAARPVRKVRIVDAVAFAKAVGAGLIPEDCIVVHMPAVNRYFKDDAETVENWPGIEAFDDVDIRSR